MPILHYNNIIALSTLLRPLSDVGSVFPSKLESMRVAAGEVDCLTRLSELRKRPAVLRLLQTAFGALVTLRGSQSSPCPLTPVPSPASNGLTLDRPSGCRVSE